MSNNTLRHADPDDLGSDLGTDDLPPIEIADETGRWRSRDITYVAGSWKSLSRIIPRFSTEDFKANPDEPPNPYMCTIVRHPLTPAERPIPVGVVSKNYHLAQHKEVIEKCFEGLSGLQITPDSLKCEIGLSTLGEWMNFRAYFPRQFSYMPGDKNELALRLECFNSVDGSSKLVILLGWLRFVCSNGLVIGETKADLRDIHDLNMDLTVIPKIIATGISKVKSETMRLQRWESTKLDRKRFHDWVDNNLASTWKKKAACRVLHICEEGTDVKILNPFDPGKPSEKQTESVLDVPGANPPARNLYDVCQALAWVAKSRSNPEERIEWQGQIPGLIESVPVISAQ